MDGNAECLDFASHSYAPFGSEQCHQNKVAPTKEVVISPLSVDWLLIAGLRKNTGCISTTAGGRIGNMLRKDPLNVGVALYKWSNM